VPGLSNKFTWENGLQCSCYFFTWRWNSATSRRKPNACNCPISSSKTRFSVQVLLSIGSWNSATTRRKPNTWSCPTSFSATGFTVQLLFYIVSWILLPPGGKQVPGLSNQFLHAVVISVHGVMLHPGGSQVPGVVQPVLLCQGFQCSYCSLQSTQSWSKLPGKKLGACKCLRSFSGTGNYSAAFVSVQGTGIPLQPGGSQVPGIVQPVLLGQDFQCSCYYLHRAVITVHPVGKQVPGNVQRVFLGQGITVQLLFLYRELEFHHSLEEAKYQVSNQFFWDRELQCSCCFCTGNWNSTTA